jgi:hypothetical protein
MRELRCQILVGGWELDGNWTLGGRTSSHTADLLSRRFIAATRSGGLAVWVLPDSCSFDASASHARAVASGETAVLTKRGRMIVRNRFRILAVVISSLAFVPKVLAQSGPAWTQLFPANAPVLM